MEGSVVAGRDIVIKDTLRNQLHGLPQHVVSLLIDKAVLLAANPFPDGKLKKKLNYLRDVCRLRLGGYRLFYTFGPAWVTLLQIRHRKDAYAGDLSSRLAARRETPPEEVLREPAPASECEAAPAVPVATWSAPSGSGPSRSQALESPITSDWLASLRVPAEYHGILCACSDEEALLSAPVPEDILQRVIDNLWRRDLDEVQRQPDYIVQDAKDLMRYKDGDLLGFLLRLDAEQEKLVSRRARGPALVKGGPGSGKSTVAMYRCKWILDRAAAENRPTPRILFTTYTNALTRFSEQLLAQLLGDRASAVTVSTADRIAWNIVAQAGLMPEPANREDLRDILEKVRRKKARRDKAASEPGGASLSRFRTDFLLQEFEWVIEGRTLTRLREYLDADRTGRGLITYGQVRNRALQMVTGGESLESYDAVIVDEAQDLTPNALVLLTALCRDRSLLFLTADANQSVYSRGFTWGQVNNALRFSGRARVLRRNYRTSKEIAEAAAAFLVRSGAGDANCLAQTHAYGGPPPVLHGYRSAEEEREVVDDFIRATTGQLRLPPRAAVVLVPTNDLGRTVASALTSGGLPAQFVKGAELTLEEPAVKVMTFHSAKGLEFPIVIVVGLKDGLLPRSRLGLTAEEQDEEYQAYRRLLFVGFTRAMRALMITYPVEKPSPFVEELDPRLWEQGWKPRRQSASAGGGGGGGS